MFQAENDSEVTQVSDQNLFSCQLISKNRHFGPAQVLPGFAVENSAPKGQEPVPGNPPIPKYWTKGWEGFDLLVKKSMSTIEAR